MNLNIQKLNNNYPHAHNLYPTTHRMLMHYSDKYKDYRKNAKGTKEIFKMMGTKNFNKLYNLRQDWDKFSREIPVKYFEVIGITESMLATTIDIDQEIFDSKIAEPYLFSHFSKSYKYFYSMPYHFEEELCEADAIAAVREWVINEDFGFLGNGLSVRMLRNPYYSIWFKADGSHFHKYQRPTYEIENQRYLFRMPYFEGLSI